MPRPKRGFNQNGKNNKSVKNKPAEVTPEPKDEWLCNLCNKMISAKITTVNVHRDACRKIKDAQDRAAANARANARGGLH
ncbi:hypothetical protein KY285_035495 [Solanum tuberosum]|nr:hypothetical protein KY285_035495 [Solanum tuberosum]